MTVKQKIYGDDSKEWLPVVKEFRELIESDGQIYKGLQQMFEQAWGQTLSVRGESDARDYTDMLRHINQHIQRAPPYEEDEYVSCNIYRTLDRVMCTPAGVATLAHPKVNSQIKKILNTRAQFLSSPESRSTLTTSEDGWFGPRASAKMPDFADTFRCNPSASHHGFNSWDDFFTRRLRPGVRPIEAPNDNSVINAPCEGRVYRIARGIKYQDRFSLKGQPYSLRDLLCDDPLAEHFVGGTIQQSLVPAINYHRWHSPVNGRVVKTELIPGVCFAQLPVTEGGPSSSPVSSQASSAHTSTRALTFIECDNPHIGLMCFMAVGLCDVSTCDARINEGDRVTKGQELGMFHFGGSTYCMIFRPGVRIEFNCGVGDATHINSAIGRVVM